MFVSCFVALALAQVPVELVEPDDSVGAVELITGARVLSPDGRRFLDDVVVWLHAGRIAKIEAVEHVQPAHVADVTHVVDLAGTWLVPGLIDLHSHLLLHPYDEASWNDQVLRESLALRTVRGVAAAHATIESGFTTLRDLGTEGAGWADVGLRDAFELGLVAGPRLLCATKALVATGCYGPSGFDPRFSLPSGAQVADGPVELRRAVREQVAAGADWIKVYADYRRRPGDASTPTFSLAELEAIVDEATSAGLPVAAHASTDEAIRRAVLAGVQTIEHGTHASAEVLALMKDRDVTLCPTLAAVAAIARYGGWSRGQEEPARMQAARATFARALAADVRIAFGSDVGVFAHGESWRELELMVAWGMSPVDALRSATAVAADVLQRPDLGRIDAGKIADLVALGADPFEDPVGALRDVRLVIQGGEVTVDHRFEGLEHELLARSKDILAAVSAGDTEALGNVFAPHAVIGSTSPGDGSARIVPAADFLASQRAPFEEWAAGPATVVVDESIGTVTLPYLLVGDGRVRTGLDVFQWIRLEDGWRIASLTYTNRSLGAR